VSLPVTTAPDLLLGVDSVALVAPDGDAVRGTMVLDGRHRGPDGRPALGALGVLVDEVLGYSIIASLPPDSWTVSTEIWVDLLAPLPYAGRLHADARTVQVGSFAVGRVLDEEGRVLAECRERGRVIDDVPDPDAPLPPAPSEAGDGLAAALGLALGDVSRLEVAPPLENPRRMLHGGVSLAASEVVATWSRMAAGCPLATSSVHVLHTRAAAYGETLELTTRTVHAGRSLWVTDVVGTVAGRPVVQARVSAQ